MGRYTRKVAPRLRAEAEPLLEPFHARLRTPFAVLGVRTAGSALAEITYLPRADLLYRQVSGLLFQSDWGGAAASGDDEGNPEPPPPPPPEADRRDTEPIPGLPPQQ